MSDWMGDVCGVTEEPPPEPARGWEFLVRARECAAGEGGIDAALAAVSAALAEREVVAALGACHREDRARLDGLLLGIAGVRGLAATSKVIARAARQEAERQEAAQRASRKRRAAEPSVAGLRASLGEALAGYDLSAELVAPPGYEVDGDGVRKRFVNEDTGEETLITVVPRPVAVVGRCRNVLDHTVTTLLAWRNVNAGWGQHTVARGTVSDARSLVTLSNLDAPFHSNNASEAVAYIAAFEDANSDVLPEAKVSPVMGWCGTEASLSFLWGRHQVRADGVFSSGAVEETPPSKWRAG